MCIMMTPAIVWGLLLLVCLSNCVAERGKRSDDSPALESVVQGHSQQLAQVTAHLNALQSQYDRLSAQFASSQRQVAFTAMHSSDPFNVAAQGVLQFNMAPNNLGNGFDTSSGVFTCPASGLYLFSISCMSVGEADVDASILANGGVLTNCYSFSNPSTEQGATSATVHLAAGQKVLVHLNRDSGRNVRGSVFTTFSGALLVPDP